jgi:hypothetical protein
MTPEQRLLRAIQLGNTICQSCSIRDHVEVPATTRIWVNVLDGDADEMGLCDRHAEEWRRQPWGPKS